MKKLYFYPAIACVMLVAGCTSSENLDNSPTSNMTLSADVEQSDDATRTYLGNYDATTKSYDVLWEANDKIGIWNNSSWSEFTLTGGMDKTRAQFSGTLSAVPTTYYAFYPSSILSGSTDKASLTLPATQTYRNEGTDHTTSQKVIAQDMWPAYSEYATQPLPFKNLCGVMRFNVKTADATEGGIITGAKLIVTGATNGLCGKYTVSGYPDPVLTAVSGSTTDSLMLTGLESKNVALNSTTYNSLYFVVPPQTYLSTTDASKTLELLVTVKKTDGTATYERMLSANKYDLPVTRSHVSPVDLLLYKKCGFVYDETFLFWGNDDIVNASRVVTAAGDGIIDVHGKNYAFPLNTIKLAYGTVYFRLPDKMLWAGDASYEVSGNPRLIRVTGPKQLDFKVYIRPDISRGKCNVEAFYAESVTATTDAAIVTELITTKANQVGDVTMPVTWNNRLGSVAKTYTGGTRLLDFTGVTSTTVDPTIMGTAPGVNASGTGWTPTVTVGTTTTSSIAVPVNSNEKLAYNYLTDVLRTNEAFIYTVNGTKTQKILLQQNEFAVMAGGIRFSGGKNAAVGATGNYVSTLAYGGPDDVSEMLGFPYGYVQSAKEPTSTTDRWNSGNTNSKIWYSVDTNVASPTFGTVTVKQGGGYNPYIYKGVASSGVTQVGDPCVYVKNPRMYSWRLMSADELISHVGNFHYRVDRQITFETGTTTLATWNAPYCWNWNYPAAELNQVSAIWFAGTLPLSNDGSWYHMYVNTGGPYNTGGGNGYGVNYEPLHPVYDSSYDYFHPYQHSRPICVRN